MIHPNELDQQLDNLRTLQQSYDQVAGAAEAYNTGKVQLAQNITAKGVDAAATETLPELAEKVAAISQETYEIDGGEMYAKQLFGSLGTPNYWNLYDILAQLLSDGRLVSYGGILLAEYYKGYDSLALSGAGAGGAYVVSDKDEQGNFIMYTEDTTHTWDTNDDGKGNRWVAYCFADAGHGFEITDTNTSPRSIHIGRSVGKITCLANSRVSEIVVTDGNTLDGFDSASYTGSWGATAIVRNMQSQSGTIFYGAYNIEKIYVKADSLSGNVLNIHDASTASLLRSLIVECKHANTLYLMYQYYAGNSLQLSYLAIKGLEDGTVYIGKASGAAFATLGLVKIINLLEVEGGTLYIYPDNTSPNLQGIKITYKTNDRTKTLIINGLVAGRMPNLTDVDIQDGWCKPLNVAFLENLTEENIVNHILNRLGDNTGQAALTITLGATNLAKLTAEEKAIATNKGFTLA